MIVMAQASSTRVFPFWQRIMAFFLSVKGRQSAISLRSGWLRADPVFIIGGCGEKLESHAPFGRGYF